MVKPPTKGMKNGLRYPRGASVTLTNRQWDDFLTYVEQRRREERADRFMQTDALRELVTFALERLLDAPDTAFMATRKRDAA